LLGFTGGSDLIGRMVAGKLSTSLGQQVVPDPRLGAAGSIAFAAGAKAAPDGYTLVMGAVPVVTNYHLNPKVGYHALRDFAAIAHVASIPNALIVHPSVPAKSLKELIAIARANPGKVAYGSGGVGSANHLANELLQLMTKVKLTHIPYKSASLGVVGAMSGEVDMVVLVASSAAGFVNAGKMRPLVVLNDKRVRSLPDTPSALEAGVPDLIAVNWYIVLAPAGTPRPIIERLNADAVAGMNTADSRERLQALGAEPNAATPAETEAFLRAEFERWGKVIREAGIKP
jgi:tripartite-type tricarboxylate transporter receptor subunit TctC